MKEYYELPVVPRIVASPVVCAGLLAAGLGATLCAILVFRISGPLHYDPVAIEGLAPLTGGQKLADNRLLQQTFRATGPNMSHVGVHIINSHSTNDEAVLSVRIFDDQRRNIGTAHTLVKNLRVDDVTLLPFAARLRSGQVYTLQLQTSGVANSSSLQVLYENDAEGFPEGDAELLIRQGRDALTPRSLPGNIRFQILRLPTQWLVADTLARSGAGLVLIAYVVILGLALIFRRHLANYWRQLAPPLALSAKPLFYRAFLLPTFVGAVMAVMVTFSYFTQLEKITTAGDVQRALTYRGATRTALLTEGEIGLWNPYLCGGEPLLANMESAQLDPFFLLVALFGENLGVRLSVTATLILGFVGTYALARRFARLTLFPALLAGGIFSFSGFQMLGFANGNFAWIPVGWIPWVVYFFLASLTASRYLIAGALVLAFIFLGGSLHMTLYALLACGLLAFFLSLLYRSGRPLFLVGIMAALFLSLAAVKLVPVSEIQAVSGEFNRPDPFIQPWRWLGKMFWDRDQLDTPQWRYEETGENFRWIEYGAYIGILPVVLAVVGAFASGRKPFFVSILGAAIVLLLMTFGEFPWTVLHNLPFLYGPLRNPQRARVVLLLFAGILAGWGLMTAGRRLVPAKIFRGIATALVAILILFDLATFHTGLYPGLFSLNPPSIEPAGTFIRLPESYTDDSDTRYYKVSYENYKAGQGVVDMCMPYMMQRGVHARGDGNSNPATPYFGEAMLTAEGEVRSVSVDGNTVHVSIKAVQPGWLVLNQNFFPGWFTDPPREVVNWSGLAAARVDSGDQEVVFRYRPWSFIVGKWITLVAAVLCLAVFVGSKVRSL